MIGKIGLRAHLKPDLHETNFSREANFCHKFFACEFAANSKFNFHWQNFFCEFAANNAKENGVCLKIVVIKKAYNLKANFVEKASKKAKKAVLGSKNLFRTSAEGGVSSFGRGRTPT